MIKLTPWFKAVPAYYDDTFTRPWGDTAEGGGIPVGDMLTEVSRANGKIKVIHFDSQGAPATLFIPERVNNYGLAIGTRTDMTILLNKYPLPEGDVEARIAIYPLAIWSGELLTDTAHVSDIRAGELMHVVRNALGTLKIRYRLNDLPVFGYVALLGPNPVKISDGVFYNTTIAFDDGLTAPVPPSDPGTGGTTDPGTGGTTPPPTTTPSTVTEIILAAQKLLKLILEFKP